MLLIFFAAIFKGIYYLPGRTVTAAMQRRFMSYVSCENYCTRVSTLQTHNTANSKQILPERELRELNPNFHIHVSDIDLYDTMIVFPILLQENYVDRSREYINRSQTHDCGDCGNWD